jgi:hypothetical protein
MKDTFIFMRLVLAVTLALVFTLLYSSASFAQKDTFGKPDTCRVVVVQDEKKGQAMASITVFNDQDLSAMTLPLIFGNGKSPVRCDSVRFRGTRTAEFDMKTQLIDTVRQTVLIGLIADMSGSKGPMKKGDGAVARMYFTVPKNQKFQDILIDTTMIKPYNVLKFVTPDVKGIYPAFDNSKALIKGGIPISSPVEKKSELPPKTGKETEVEKSKASEGTDKK